MRRALPYVPVTLLLATAAALTGSSAATRAGTVTFSGHVIDASSPFVPGSIVTVHGQVVARSESCIEAHIDVPAHPLAASLWLCSPSASAADQLPDVGEAIAARARIIGIKTTPAGSAPLSDSFVLLRSE